MNKKVYQCPSCSKEFGTDEMDLNEEKHTLNCPSCGAVIIEGYRGE